MAHVCSFVADKCDGQAVYCDCEDCTEQYWNSQVGDFTCGERIRGLQIRQDLGLNENDACKIVSEEFPGEFSLFCFIASFRYPYMPSHSFSAFTVGCGPNCNPGKND